MASIILDLTLCETDSWDETFPGTPERERVVADIFERANVRLGAVTFKVLREHGPAGGNPECEFIGPRDEIEKIVNWAIDEMNEGPEWADEFWTDRD
jgi:hypothetical protein